MYDSISSFVHSVLACILYEGVWAFSADGASVQILHHVVMSCAYMYTTCIHACLRGYADHPQDERLHHTIDRTDERFDLWRFIVITNEGRFVSWISSVRIFINYVRGFRKLIYEGNFVLNNLRSYKCNKYVLQYFIYY